MEAGAPGAGESCDSLPAATAPTQRIGAPTFVLLFDRRKTSSGLNAGSAARVAGGLERWAAGCGVWKELVLGVPSSRPAPSTACALTRNHRLAPYWCCCHHNSNWQPLTCATWGWRGGWQVLAFALYSAYDIRTFALKTYGMVIHEFGEPLSLFSSPFAGSLSAASFLGGAPEVQRSLRGKEGLQPPICPRRVHLGLLPLLMRRKSIGLRVSRPTSTVAAMHSLTVRVTRPRRPVVQLPCHRVPRRPRSRGFLQVV